MPNVIQSSYEILSFPENVLENIELAARTCYKSEGSVCEGSAERLVNHLIGRGHHAMLEFGGDIVVKFIANRGFTHEIVRHRICSFAQESTRYCNYSKWKFGGSVTFCDPTAMLEMKTASAESRARWKSMLLSSWARSEQDYLDLVVEGCPAEVAREVLPIGTKAEIVVKGNVREWRHILRLRSSKRVHPRMRELMVPLLADFRKLMPVVFDDLGHGI